MSSLSFPPSGDSSPLTSTVFIDSPSSSNQSPKPSSVFPGLPNFRNNIDMEALRCSMPTLSNMPSTARHIVSSMFSFFNSPSNASVGDKGSGKSSTPQVDRKNKVGQRRMSEGDTEKKNHRVQIPNIETWEPDVQEKELLRKTWSDDFDFLYNLGAAIYVYIFEHNPACKKVFPFIANYQGDDWKETKEFRSQALKFVQTLSQVVKNLYHMERLEPFLYGIGQRHVRFANRGFKAEYWDIFQDAMEASLSDHMKKLPDLSEQQSLEAVRVWRTLALYVTTHMKKGFNDGMNGINKQAKLD